MRDAILIVDGRGDGPELGRRLAAALPGRPVVSAARTVDEDALARAAVAVVDADLDGRGAAAVVHSLRERAPGLPVVVVTPRTAPEDAHAALDGGATAVLADDARPEEIAATVGGALEGRAVVSADLMLATLARSTALLADARRRDTAVIESLAAAVEAKDLTTSRHLRSVGRLAVDLAGVVDGDLARSQDFLAGCLLHDVGKIGVPEDILTKPGPLNDEEWIVMRAHPLTGVRVIEPLALSEVVEEIVLHHHERWDGEGYPYGLAGPEIPLAARIFSLCDALDAMTTNRPYRRALPAATALDRVRREAGGQFDPQVVRALEAGLEAGALRLSPRPDEAAAPRAAAPAPASRGAHERPERAATLRRS